MYFMYLATLVVSGFYFVKRPVDVFTFAYISSAIYFIPGLIPAFDVEPGSHAIYSCVLIFLVLAAFVHQSVRKPGKGCLPVDEPRMQLFYRSALVLYVPAAMVWLLELAGSPIESKSDADGGLIHYAAAVSLGYVFIGALALGRWTVVGVCLVNYGLIVISGDRTQLLIAIIAALMFHATVRRWSILDLAVSVRPPILLAGFVALAIGIFGKDVYGAYFDTFAGDDFIAALERRATDTIRDPSGRFEPYHVQKILNYAVRYDDRVSPDYLFLLPMQVLPMSGEVGGDVHAQSRIIKRMYFPEWREDAGVSSNFFAEGFLLFGYVGALLFAFIYALGVFMLARLVVGRNPVLRVAGCFGAAFWVFYIHRSSVFQIIGHEKRVFYSAVAIAVIMSLVKIFVSVGRKGRR